MIKPDRGSTPTWTDGIIRDVVASIRGGISVECEERPARDTELGVLKTGAVLTGRLDLAQQKVVPTSQYTRLRTPLRAGTIVLCRKNSEDAIGASALVEEDHPTLFLSDLLWEIGPSANAEVRWLLYILQSPEIRREIQVRATGTQNSMKIISHDKLYSIRIKIPPRHQQDRIVDILATWDRGIDAAISSAACASRLLDGLLMRLLDCCVDRKQWHTNTLARSKLGEIFSERAVFGGKGDRLLSVTGSEGIIDREDVERRDTSSEDKSRYKRVMPGDIAYNTMRMWQGVGGLSSLSGIVSPAYTVVIPNQDRIDPQFAAYLFKSPRMIRRFHQYSQGLVDDTLSLKYPQFAEIEVAIPTLDEQRRIVAGLDNVSAEIRIRRREIDSLRCQRNALASELLTGRLRVGEAERLAVAAG